MNKYFFKEFVETLVAGLRAIEKAESPIGQIHPVMVRENNLSPEGRRDFGLGFPVCEDEGAKESDPINLVSDETTTPHPGGGERQELTSTIKAPNAATWS